MAKKSPNKQASNGHRLQLPKATTASVYSHPESLPTGLSGAVDALSQELNAPVFLLVQNPSPDENFSTITYHVYKGFQRIVDSIPADRAVLLIDSPGGDPNYAFKLARLFQRRCRDFVVVVPQYAKSAATLVSLGATDLVMGRDAEIGPLDIQVFDPNEERYDSALNSVQALERLGAYAMTTVDQTMMLLISRLRKRTDILLPFALEYVANLLRPLMEKVDTTDYARKSRDLKVAEEYAARLMRRQYGFRTGRAIARQLVQRYPAHGFVIDCEEAVADDDRLDQNNAFGLGLQITEASTKVQGVLDSLMPCLDEVTAIGRIVEANHVGM